MSQTFGAGKYGRATEDGAVVLRGFEQLQRALGRIEGETKAELQSKIRGIGERVALVAAHNAPRLTGELQHSIRVSAFSRGASVYSTAIYGGAQNFGAWTKDGRGPHISRANASHYMSRAVTETAPWVQRETEAVLDWLTTTFQED